MDLTSIEVTLERINEKMPEKSPFPWIDSWLLVMWRGAVLMLLWDIAKHLR